MSDQQEMEEPISFGFSVKDGALFAAFVGLAISVHFGYTFFLVGYKDMIALCMALVIAVHVLVAADSFPEMQRPNAWMCLPYLVVMPLYILADIVVAVVIPMIMYIDYHKDITPRICYTSACLLVHSVLFSWFWILVYNYTRYLFNSTASVSNPTAEALQADAE